MEKFLEIADIKIKRWTIKKVYFSVQLLAKILIKFLKNSNKISDKNFDQISETINPTKSMTKNYENKEFFRPIKC